MYVCMYVCMCVCTYVYEFMYVRMYACIHILCNYVHTRKTWPVISDFPTCLEVCHLGDHSPATLIGDTYGCDPWATGGLTMAVA